MTLQSSRRRPDHRNRTGIALCLSLIIVSATATAAQAAWTVTVNGTDVTSVAAPIDKAGVPVGNAITLASYLGLQSAVDSTGFWISDPNGTIWRAVNGDRFLVSASKTMPLSAAVDIEGPSVYLPLDALASLSGLALTLSSDHTHASFGAANATSDGDEPGGASAHASALAHTGASAQPAPVPSATGNLDNGWTGLTIPKTAAELALLNHDSSDFASETRLKANPPPTQDALNVETGLGYVEGEDFGLAFSGGGEAFGSGVHFNGLVADGDSGLNLINTSLQINDWDRRLRFEGGQIFSELWGASTGLRLSLLQNTNPHNTMVDSSIAFYAGTNLGERHDPLVAFTDEAQVLRKLLVGCELGSDGSYLFKQRLATGPLSLYGYERWLHLNDGGNGILGSLRLTRGVSLIAGASNEGAGVNRNDYRNVGLSFPVYQDATLTITRSATLTGTNHNDATGFTLGLPIGPVTFSTAYQWGHTGEQLPDFTTVFTDMQTLTMTAGYSPNPRTRFDYEVASQWQADGSTTNYDQLVTHYRLGNATDLQLISGMPDLFDQNILRVRLDQALSSTRSLSLDYGQLEPFESITTPVASDRGFELMFNEAWEAKTPATGAQVSGHVLDIVGRPVRSTLVRLGAWSELTDAKGIYRFKDVPSGSYQIYVDEQSLPANFRQKRERRTIQVDSGSKQTVDFLVTPQGSVTGRVFIDHGDGVYHRGDGIADAVVHMGKAVTATGPDGVYAFYNVDPGPVTITLDTDRLPVGYAAEGDSSAHATLKADQSLTEIDFKVVYHDKAVIYQDASDNIWSGL